MKKLFPLSFSVSLFMAPDFLTVFGNGLGNSGVLFLFFLSIVFGLHLFTAKTYLKLSSEKPEFNNEYFVNSSQLGNAAGFIFPFISKTAMAVCIGVGLLATAGYAFNEMFVRSFPNMGFSFSALGFLLLIGLSGKSIVKIFQVLFSGIALFGIAALVVMGLFTESDSGGFSAGFLFFNFGGISSLLPCFILLMGFELADHSSENKLQKNMAVTGLFISFAVLLLWGAVSLIHVSPERLADTYVPHLITARLINTEIGRTIMGLVIISASLGAVNALLSYLVSIGDKVFLPELKPNRSLLQAVIFILPVLLITGLLASGMAGEPEFETFIRGSIYLWLLSYGVTHLAAFVYLKKSGAGKFEPFSSKGVFNLITFIFIFIIYCGLILTDHERMLIFSFTAGVIGVSLFAYLLYRKLFINPDKG